MADNKPSISTTAEARESALSDITPVRRIEEFLDRIGGKLTIALEAGAQTIADAIGSGGGAEVPTVPVSVGTGVSVAYVFGYIPGQGFEVTDAVPTSNEAPAIIFNNDGSNMICVYGSVSAYSESATFDVIDSEENSLARLDLVLPTTSDPMYLLFVRLLPGTSLVTINYIEESH